MRHLVKGSKLGRTASHRKATLSALAVALIHERRITTTVTKAKELRRYVEPLITRSKVDSTHNRRQVFAKLQDKYAVTELFEEVGPLVQDRPGGYTRVIKLGFRVGDAAELAMIELVDFNDVPPETQEVKKKRTRRAGKSAKDTTSKPVAKKDRQDADQAAAGKSENDAEADNATKEVTSEENTQQSSELSADDSSSTENIKTAKSDTSEATDDAGDYKVEEVKQKLDDMSLEEAKKFAGEDDRVTVQKALKKKIEDASK